VRAKGEGNGDKKNYKKFILGSDGEPMDLWKNLTKSAIRLWVSK